jgi:hypothetical protein
MDQVKECAFENAPEMKKAVWTLESIGHIRQRSGLIVAGESEDMDGHGWAWMPWTWMVKGGREERKCKSALPG